jgi:hypothetical protein
MGDLSQDHRASREEQFRAHQHRRLAVHGAPMLSFDLDWTGLRLQSASGSRTGGGSAGVFVGERVETPSCSPIFFLNELQLLGQLGLNSEELSEPLDGIILVPHLRQIKGTIKLAFKYEHTSFESTS